MADSSAFENVCAGIERLTSLERLEARGTVRLALKTAGLDPRSVGADEMAVVLEKILPGELERRGVEGAARQCRAVRTGLAGIAPEALPEKPEDVFRRLGGGA